MCGNWIAPSSQNSGITSKVQRKLTLTRCCSSPQVSMPTQTPGFTVPLPGTHVGC